MTQNTTVLYSTGCPRCEILKKKLYDAGIQFEICTDVAKMESLGIEYAPVLAVGDKLMEFMTAVAWVNAQRGA